MGHLGFWLRWSLRDLRRRWALVTTLALVVALATGVGAGLGSMEEWRIRSNDASFAALDMHDLRVTLAAGGTAAEGELAAAVADLPGAPVTGAQERLIVPTQVDASGGGRTVLVPGRLVGVPLAGEGSGIDSRFVQEGRDLRPADAGRPVAVVDGHFARHHALPIPVEVRVAGGGSLRIVGRVLQPEQFLVTRSGTVGAESGYAVLYTSLATAQALGGRPGRVDELVLTLAPGADPALVEAQVRRALAARLPGVAVEFTRRADEDVHRVLYEDARSDQRLVDVFAWLLLAGAALASFNLVSRVVESQRREIGIGMALGVSPATLAIRPLLFAAEVSALGVAAGIVVGLVVNRAFRGVLDDMLMLPVWETPLLPGVYVRAALLGLAVPLVAAAYPVARAVAVRPVDAIRVGALTASRSGLAPVLERLRLPGSSLGKMPVRNLARTPRRTLMSALGIAAVITVLVALAGVFDSFGAALDASRAEALHDNPQRMTASLTEVGPADGPAVRAIAASPEVRDAEPVLVMPVTLGRGDDAVDASLELLDPGGGVWSPRITEGTFAPGSPGIVLAGRAADDLGVGVGDTVALTRPVRTGPDSFATATTEVPVVALHANPLRGLAYMDRGQASLFGLAGAANAVEIRPRGSQDAVARALFGMPGVALVESGAAVPDAVRRYMDRFLAILRITQFVTLLLAVLIAVNTMSIAGEERRREHATMMAFGIPRRSILRNAVVESVLIGALGTLAGIAGGLVLLGWIVNVVSRETYPDLGLPVTLSAASIATTALVGLVAVGLSPLLGAGGLRRMDIPSTLRVVE